MSCVYVWWPSNPFGIFQSHGACSVWYVGAMPYAFRENLGFRPLNRPAQPSTGPSIRLACALALQALTCTYSQNRGCFCSLGASQPLFLVKRLSLLLLLWQENKSISLLWMLKEKNKKSPSGPMVAAGKRLGSCWATGVSGRPGVGSKTQQKGQFPGSLSPS